MNGLLLTLVLLHCGDGATTATAIAHGAREANPLLPQSIGSNLAMQSAVTSLQVIGLKRLSVHHPKLAKALLWTAIGVEGGIVVANVRTLQQIQK